jgi:hypothetical protein
MLNAIPVSVILPNVLILNAIPVSVNRPNVIMLDAIPVSVIFPNVILLNAGPVSFHRMSLCLMPFLQVSFGQISGTIRINLLSFVLQDWHFDKKKWKQIGQDQKRQKNDMTRFKPVSRRMTSLRERFGVRDFVLRLSVVMNENLSSSK